MKRIVSLLFGAAIMVVAPAQADIVTVTAEGTVVFNGVTTPPLNAVGSGDSATMSFQVDSNVFVNGASNTRGYEIIQPTFLLAFNPPPVAVGLVVPFPAGQTPYFTLANGIPVADGFWVSTSPNSPGGVPLSQTPLQANLDLGYTGTTLSSLNILDAVGTYDFTGLTRFSFTLWQAFPDNVRMEIDFARLTIVPEPASFLLLAAIGLAVLRRRA